MKPTIKNQRAADVAYVRKLGEAYGKAGRSVANAIAIALEREPLLGEKVAVDDGPMPGPDDDTGEGDAE